MIAKHIMNKISALLVSSAMVITSAPAVAFADDSNDSTGSFYGTYDVIYKDQNGNILEPDLIPDNVVFLDKGDSAVNSSYFNLADEGRVTSVKSQSPLGSCWAHAGIAAAESSMITKGLATSDVDYSEQHLMWFSNGRGPSDPSDPLYGDCGLNYGIDCYDEGGTIYSVMGALTSWQGVQLEENAPYEDAVALKELPESQRYVSYGHAREILMYDSSDIESIKHALVNIGACSLSYYDNSQYFNDTNSAYYCNTSHSTNHAVTLVGWDDNYSKENFNSGTQPSSDGAWILKNSWGTWWGDEGYFYMSYEDATASKITSIEMDSNTNYTDIYQYDASIGLEKVSSTSLSVNIYDYGTAFQGVNIFTAKNDNPLTAVGFYTFDAETPYEVRIYTDVDTSAKTGTLAYSATGTFTYGGFHTLDLIEAIELAEGEKFAISVIYTDADKARVAFDYKGADGTSYMTWIEEGVNYSWYDANQREGSGVCIKGYTAAAEPEVPAIPTNVTATEINGEINITWDKVEGAEAYRLYRATSEDGEKDLVISTNTNTVIDGNADYGTQYYYYVQAYNSDTAVSDFSAPATAMRVYMPAPEISNVYVNGIKTRISWTAVDGAVMYCIYRADSSTGEKTLLQSGIFESLMFTDNDDNLKQATTYYYYIQAVSGYYTSEYSEAAVSTTEDIAAPVITGAVASDKDITITWQAVEDALRYHVFRSDSVDGEKTQLGNSTSLSYTDSTAEYGKIYYYYVQAYSLSPRLTSVYSEPISASISALTAPEITSISAEGGTVTLSWSTVNGATSYRIFRADSATGARTQIKIRTTPNYTDATVEEGKTYYYFVAAYNASTAELSELSECESIAVPKPFGSPEITSISAEDSTVTLAWSTVNGATSYRIFRADSETGEKKLLKVRTTPNYTDSTVEEGKTYYYFVAAYNASTAELSEFSQCESIAVPKSFGAPEITSISTEEGTVTLAWSTVNGATSYRIFRADSATGARTQIKIRTTPNYTDATVEAGKTYYYFVAAYNASTAELSELSECESIAVPKSFGAPEITSISAEDGTVTLAWSTVNGATSYRIFRADSATGARTQIKIRTTPNYTDATVEAGKTYYYFVAAYNASTAELSELSECESIAVPKSFGAPEITSISAEDGTVTLAWSTVNGATSYRIFRADSATGARTQIKIRTTPNYTDTTVEEGKTYYYFVAAYNASTAELSELSEYEQITV